MKSPWNAASSAIAALLMAYSSASIGICPTFSEVSSNDTPPDFLAYANACISVGDAESAAIYTNVALAYHRYDVQRVLDIHAPHLSTTTLNPPNESRHGASITLQQYDAKMLEFDTDTSKVCPVVLALGPPSYYPDYMLDSGKAQARGDGREWEIREGFSSTRTWAKIMNGWKCELPSSPNDHATFENYSELVDHVLCTTFVRGEDPRDVVRRELLIQSGEQRTFDFLGIRIQVTAAHLDGLFEIEFNAWVPGGMDIHYEKITIDPNDPDAQPPMPQFVEFQHPRRANYYYRSWCKPYALERTRFSNRNH
ncbi:MAG: hypothetical protein DHS20C11_32290 [Lysobacteraceae bacterium]|nr:MAG: hypothetical protein DHS20C11_32290 [Xanthomonadaceae bacterium]